MNDIRDFVELSAYGTEKLFMNIILMLPIEKTSARLMRVVSQNLYTLFGSELFDISYEEIRSQEYAKIDEDYDSVAIDSTQVTKTMVVPMILKRTPKYRDVVTGIEYAPGAVYPNGSVAIEAPSNECFVRVHTKPISPRDYLKRYTMTTVIEYLIKYFSIHHRVDIKVLFGSDTMYDGVAVLMDRESIDRHKQMYLDIMVFVESK